MEQHECKQERTIKNIDEKLDKIDEKLDKKFDTYNDLLNTHMKRTVILETRQDSFLESQKDLKKSLDEINAFFKKVFWYAIIFFFLMIFKDNAAVLEVIKSLVGVGM